MPESKAELEAKIAELERKLAEADEKRTELEEELARNTREGWIITTPNPKYTGITAGVLFESGHAFVPKTLKNSQVLIRRLVGDFGYTAIETQGEELEVQEKQALGMEALVEPTVRR